MPELVADEPRLVEMRLQPYNRNVDFYLNRSRRSRFDTEQEYQRGLTWDVDRKRNLIKSILMGLPVGAVIINDRGFQADGSPEYAIIDGKQRITALWEFTDDEFAIPLGWLKSKFAPEDVATEMIVYEGRPVRGVRFSALTPYFRRTVESAPLMTLQTDELTIQQEAEVFLLINTGGVAPDAAVLACARRLAAEEVGV